jgi:succinate dehydrogenase flavin-adding protein (antitoxin of CptAB toxin-antitoxin module)
MRELDDLLLGYLDRCYDLAPDDEKQAFQTLLGLSDPEIVGYLLNNQEPATELRRVVEHILERPGA